MYLQNPKPGRTTGEARRRGSVGSGPGTARRVRAGRGGARRGGTGPGLTGQGGPEPSGAGRWRNGAMRPAYAVSFSTPSAPKASILHTFGSTKRENPISIQGTRRTFEERSMARRRPHIILAADLRNIAYLCLQTCRVRNQDISRAGHDATAQASRRWDRRGGMLERIQSLLSPEYR